jgi:hypothetical protein
MSAKLACSPLTQTFHVSRHRACSISLVGQGTRHSSARHAGPWLAAQITTHDVLQGA